MAINDNTLIQSGQNIITDPEYKPTVEKKSSLGDVVGSVFELSFKDNAVNSFYRTRYNNIAAEEGEKIAPEILNEKYSVEVPFNEPVTEKFAQRLHEEHVERQRLREIIERGHGGVVETVASFAASMAAQVADPISIGLGVLTGSVVTKTIAGLATRSNAALKLHKAIKAGKNPLKIAIAENVTGNLIEEAAFVIPNSIQERRQIEIQNNLLNAVYGGVGVTAAFKAVGYSAKQLGKFLTNAELRMNAGKVALGDDLEIEAATGKVRKDLTKNIDQLEQEIFNSKDPEFIARKTEELNEAKESLADIENELKDEVAIRERANADDQDMYFNQKSMEEAEQYKPGQVDLKASVNEEFEAFIAEIDDPDFKLELETEFNSFKETRTKVPEMVKAAYHCVTQALTGV